MGTRTKATRFPWFYFFLSFAITWLIWSPGILSSGGLIRLPVPFTVFFFVGTWGPFLAASMAIFRSGKWEGVKKFWKRGLNCHFHWRWLLIITVMALLVSAFPLGVHLLFGGTAPVETLLSKPWMIIPVFLVYFLTGGGNEEWGWRGYALEQLQRRWNPAAASVILGLIWGFWHAPLFFIEGTGQYHMSLVVFIVASPGLSILHTWVYNKTGRNIMAPWLLHAALGTFWEIFPIVQPQIEGYQRVYIFDFVTAAILAAGVVAIAGTRLGASGLTHRRSSGM